jgi:hypothetical protein
MKQMTTHIDDIKNYINQRITQTEEYIAVEELAGNMPKLMAEKSAQCELYGLLKFIEDKGL